MKNTPRKFRFVPSLAALLCTATVALTSAGTARADVASGKTAFAICAACHSTSGGSGVGPHLDGVVGRKAGSVSGFNYSRAMKNANIVWDDKTLAAFIANPQSTVPGNHMPFSGLQDSAQRASIIAFLKSLP